MKLLLIKPEEPQGGIQKTCVMPPLGLHTLKAVVGDECEVDIVDEHLGESPYALMAYWKPDIVGISCQYSIQHDGMLRLAKNAQMFGAQVIAGGFHAATLKDIPNVNHIIRGPGEAQLAHILQIDPPQEHVYPQWTEYDLKPYWDKNKPHNLKSKTKRWVNMETSRGCNYRCGFCGVRNFWGKWEGFPMEDIQNHFYALRSIGIEELFIEDDNMTYNKERFKKIFRGETFYWSTPNGIRVRDLDPETIGYMAASRCWRVSLPFETGSLGSADLMNVRNKWLPLKEAKEICKNLADNGIEAAGFFIIGYPGETPDDVARTLDYANSLPLDDRYIYIATPYPGTPLYNLCKKENYLICDGEDLYRRLRYSACLIRTPWLEPEVVERMKKEDRDAHRMGGKR